MVSIDTLGSEFFRWQRIDGQRTSEVGARSRGTDVGAVHFADQRPIIGIQGDHPQRTPDSAERSSLVLPRRAEAWACTEGTLRRRHRPGLIPTISRNRLLRCAWSANPQARATSASRSLVPLIIAFARSTRLTTTYSIGDHPTLCLKAREK